MGDDKIKTFPKAKRYTPDDLTDEVTMLHDCYGDGQDRSHAFAIKYKNREDITIVCLGCGTPMPLSDAWNEEDE